MLEEFNSVLSYQHYRESLNWRIRVLTCEVRLVQKASFFVPGLV